MYEILRTLYVSDTNQAFTDICAGPGGLDIPRSSNDLGNSKWDLPLVKWNHKGVRSLPAQNGL